MSIEEIAKPVVRKDKFGGLHFFNPVPVMKLLEVIRIPTTSNVTFNTLLEFGKSIGKTTVSCKVCFFLFYLSLLKINPNIGFF